MPDLVNVLSKTMFFLYQYLPLFCVIVLGATIFMKRHIIVSSIAILYWIAFGIYALLCGGILYWTYPSFIGGSMQSYDIWDTVRGTAGLVILIFLVLYVIRNKRFYFITSSVIMLAVILEFWLSCFFGFYAGP